MVATGLIGTSMVVEKKGLRVAGLAKVRKNGSSDGRN